ncbi:hypothetical protein HKX48_002417 [Thoreauomyces humboldtii]|nr:hypothetical protein HKX48_002417 [Thoreauomyces humboldtii]
MVAPDVKFVQYYIPLISSTLLPSDDAGVNDGVHVHRPVRDDQVLPVDHAPGIHVSQQRLDLTALPPLDASDLDARVVDESRPDLHPGLRSGLSVHDDRGEMHALVGGKVGLDVDYPRREERRSMGPGQGVHGASVPLERPHRRETVKDPPLSIQEGVGTREKVGSHRGKDVSTPLGSMSSHLLQDGRDGGRIRTQRDDGPDALISRPATQTLQRSHYLNARTTLRHLLKLNVVPIVNENDTVSSSELRFGDNDTLSAITAGMVNAECLFLLTDVPCLYTAIPRLHPDATPIRLVRNVAELRTTCSVDAGGSDLGTGGMVTKLVAAGLAAP